MKFTHQILEDCRTQFPALSKQVHGQTAVYLDGPAGTQVPQCVVDSMQHYLFGMNANSGGVFETSLQTGEVLRECHQAAADFVGADDPGEIAFGQNMTSLTFALSRSLAQTWSASDELIVTRLDHDANISPWVLAARDAGATVHHVEFDANDGCRLMTDQFHELLNDRTRLVAFGAASNASGGINPVQSICEVVRQHSDALTFVDAVHYGPHGLIDVQTWDCDFLACSAYKFFGPHQGMIWGKRHLLEQLPAYKVRPAYDSLPEKWMSGTQSHEGICGTKAAIDYLADIGRKIANDDQLSRRQSLQVAFEGITEYEQSLSVQVIEGLNSVPDIRIHGICEVSQINERVPTFSITHPAIGSRQLATALARAGIFVWDGNYYALEFSEKLGLEPEGMVRIGLVHYNTASEVTRLIESIRASVDQAVVQNG